MKRAREAVSVCLGRLSEAPAHKPGSAIRAGKDHEDHLALDVFSPPPSDISPQTVHAIKGEEREALMMVVHRASARDPTQQLAMLEIRVWIEGRKRAERKARAAHIARERRRLRERRHRRHKAAKNKTRSAPALAPVSEPARELAPEYAPEPAPEAAPAPEASPPAASPTPPGVEFGI